jgi:hypothetical protein
MVKDCGEHIMLGIVAISGKNRPGLPGRFNQTPFTLLINSILIREDRGKYYNLTSLMVST